MKKKIMAIVLTVAMCTMASMTAFAASSSVDSSSSGGSGSKRPSSSSSSSSSSGSQSGRTEATKGNVNTDSVVVAVVGSNGSVSKVNLTQYTQRVSTSVVNVAASSAAGGANAGEAVSALMSNPASEVFKATINALGGKIRLVNTGGYKVVAATPDASGRTVASVGSIKGVTKYAFVILTGVRADGTVEIVEGTVDPVSLQVMGAFTSTPASITVSVVMPAQ